MSLFWAQWVGNFEKPNGQSGTIATAVGIVIIKVDTFFYWRKQKTKDQP